LNTQIDIIKDSIKEILNKIFSVKIFGFSEDYCNEDLLGDNFGLKARDLLRLYFEIEKEFKVEIREGDILVGKFRTINNIADCIYKEIT